MTERGSGSVERSATRLRIGPSALTSADGRLTVDIDEWTVPTPRKLRGRITVDLGTIFNESFELDDLHRHSWRPIAPCAQATVAFEKPNLEWRGKAYVDMNEGSEPLEAGFRYWTWSRAEAGAATRILYDIEPRQGTRRTLALQYDPSGTIERTDPDLLQALPGTGWRVRRETRADPKAPARVLRTLEDTPFYTRSMLASGTDGAEGRAVHESVDLDRFRSRWVQTLLPFKMPRRSG